MNLKPNSTFAKNRLNLVSRASNVVILLAALALMGCATNRSSKSATSTTRAEAKPSLSDISHRIGEEFKVKDIDGKYVTATIFERDGKYFIRSQQHHGWASGLHDFALPNTVQFFVLDDRAITIFFPSVEDAHAPNEQVVGAVYVINGHGEPVRVDDITFLDLHW